METARETSARGHVISKGFPLLVGTIVLAQLMILYHSLVERVLSGSTFGSFEEGGVDWEPSYPIAHCACKGGVMTHSLGTARDTSNVLYTA